ncbi:flavin reductase family protein [Cytophaga aurantiaca]|uniref:flavin reductase family protein n=1 Tax=Cytophaga aurantiaca TaxID=29530 RepID=UPI00037CD09D|nr:flavin reductase [Cytophaga aurantiaca]
MIIDKETLSAYENRYRATFINSLAGIKQAFLIGTKSKDGFSNLAIFNSLIHIGANPPLWGFICRPDVVKRDTLNNILETGYYTINYVSATDFSKAHKTSAKFSKEISEFDACGFTEVYNAAVDVPFVAEAHIKVLMKLQQKIDITINNTIMIIGSIEQIEIDKSIVSADGFVALDKSNTLACAGLDAYYATYLIDRLQYATTDALPLTK